MGVFGYLAKYPKTPKKIIVVVDFFNSQSVEIG
jgi:hypothetical protein